MNEQCMLRQTILLKKCLLLIIIGKVNTKKKQIVNILEIQKKCNEAKIEREKYTNTLFGRS